MEHYAELDVSPELTSVCIVDERGTIVRETGDSDWFGCALRIDFTHVDRRGC